MPRPDGSFYPKEERLSKVLPRLVSEHPEWINGEYATAASEELGEPVAAREVSALRGKIRLVWSKVRGYEEFQFTADDVKRAWRLGYEEGVRQGNVERPVK